MTDRPNVRVPVFATTELYDQPGYDFDGTDTKVDPGTAFEAAGYTPRTRHAAQHENWFANALGRWVSYLRDIPVKNWADTDRAHWLAQSLNGACYVPGADKWLFGREKDGIGILVSSSEGSSFLSFTSNTILPGAGQLGSSFLITPDSDVKALIAVAEWGVQCPDIWSFVAGRTPSEFVLEAAYPFDSEFRIMGMVCLHSAPLWIVIGWDADDSDVDTYYSTDGSSWTKSYLRASGIDDPVFIAVNQTDDLILATISLAASEETKVYSSVDGMAWSLLGSLAVGGKDVGPICSLTYANGVFMALGEYYEDTPKVLKAFTSTDGVTWVERGGLGDPAAVGGLACSGGTWIAMINSATDIFEVYASHDDGSTWIRVVHFESDLSVLTHGLSCMYAAGRFVVILHDGTDGMLLASLCT